MHVTSLSTVLLTHLMSVYGKPAPPLRKRGALKVCNQVMILNIQRHDLQYSELQMVVKLLALSDNLNCA